MADVIRLHADHPLVGSWAVKDDEGGIQYTVTASAQGFTVAAIDQRDGERLEVSNVSWDGHALRFSVFVPSNGHRAEHTLRLREEDGCLDDNFTAHHHDVLKRKDS